MVRFEPVASRRVLKGHLTWFGLWLFVTVVGICLAPSPKGHGTHTQLGLPPCPSVMVFGRPCPGCGLTTSFTATIHGHFLQAFQAHAFGPVMYILFTITALCCFYGYVTMKRFNTDSKQFSWALGALIAVFLTYGGIRFIADSDYAKDDWTIRSAQSAPGRL